MSPSGMIRADRAAGKEFLITKINGKTLRVKLIGDEHNHYYVTPDGYVLVSKDNELYYAVATQDGIHPGIVCESDYMERSEDEIAFLGEALTSDCLGSLDMNVRKSSLSRRKAPGLRPDAGFPSVGEQRALVLLVEYKDVKFSTPDPADYFNRMLNQRGFSDNGGTGSASDYFRTCSSGVFKPQFDVFGPITLKENRSYYGGDNALGGRDANAWRMAVEGCQAIDAGVDFGDYDRNNDGFIDNVFVIFAGQGQSSGGPVESVWPHSWTLAEATTEIHSFDNLKLNRYGCANELEGAVPDGVGTFIHEFSHVLGLPDLYSTVYNSAFTPGPWSVLDAGPDNNSGCTPPLYGAFERYALGWLTPREIKGNVEVTLNPISCNEACIIPTSDQNEYFLLENRQLEDWDRFLPGHGMLIWHIHYDPQIWTNAAVNNDMNHQRVDIEEADGIKSNSTRAGDPFPGTFGITEFTDETYPSMKTWSNQSLNLPITDITENTDGTVSFKVKGGVSGVRDMEDTFYRIVGSTFITDCETEIIVCDISGRIIYSGICTSFKFPDKGIYIINVEGKRIKTII